MSIKKKIAVIMIAFFLFTGLCSFAYATKIGVVNMQKVVEQSSPGKAASLKMKNELKNKQADIQSKAKELVNLKKKLESEASVMKAEKREKQVRDFKIKASDLDLLKRKYERDIQTLQNKLLVQLNKNIGKIVQDIARKEGFELIINANAGVLHATKNMDLTDRVIKILNGSK